MRRLARSGILLAALAAAGCAGSSKPDAGPIEDAGPADAGLVDSGPVDAGPADAGPVDAGPVDAGSVDAGPVDAGSVDAGPVDAGPVDAGPVDAGPADAGPVDAGLVDAGPMDSGTPDAGQVDAGHIDAGHIDAGPVDAGPVGTEDAGAENSVTGALGFSVVTSVALPAFAACGTCGTLEDGGLSATAFFLSDQEVMTQACELGDAGFADNTHVIVIQLAAPDYVSCSASGGMPGVLAPGNYPILDEHVADEDVCGNIPLGETSALAILQYLFCPAGGPNGCIAEGWGESGIVTVTSVSGTSVSGTFDVEVGAELEDGGIPDGGAPKEVTGSFDTAACPIIDAGMIELDAGSVDAGPPDAGPGTELDAGPEDAGSMTEPDAGSADAGPVDAGSGSTGQDAGPADAGSGVTPPPCLEGCFENNTAAYTALEGYLLTDCACASGAPCAAACTGECPSDSTPSTACAECLLGELEQLSFLSCGESAVESCAGDSACQAVGTCVAACEL